MSNMNKDISRRDFLKTMGVAGLATAGLVSCVNKQSDDKPSTTVNSEIPKDKMTYRTCHTTGDRVSLLGYGMMRLPTKPVPGAKEGEDEEIDQDAVNRFVDYAIEHGVN